MFNLNFQGYKKEKVKIRKKVKAKITKIINVKCKPQNYVSLTKQFEKKRNCQIKMSYFLLCLLLTKETLAFVLKPVAFVVEVRMMPIGFELATFFFTIARLFFSATLDFTLARL